MLLRFASDLHLEFDYEFAYVDSLIPIMDTDKDTILILLGDIHVGTGIKFFLNEMSSRFKAVIYVLGNHEFYGYKFYDLKHEISDMFIDTNVYVLENESITIDGQKFIGCTLWTDMAKENPTSIINVGNGLNDYFYIKNEHGQKIKPYETIQAHKDSIDYLTTSIDKDTIVLTHHAPLIGFSDPMFKNSKISSGFESDLMDLILDLQPKYWLYGHTHYNVGLTEVENTILLSNQLGYPDLGENIGYDPKLIINLDQETDIVGEHCEICNTFVEGFEYQMCCSGQECGCMGMPVELCWCSQECQNEWIIRRDKQSELIEVIQPTIGEEYEGC